MGLIILNSIGAAISIDAGYQKFVGVFKRLYEDMVRAKLIVVWGKMSQLKIKKVIAIWQNF